MYETLNQFGNHLGSVDIGLSIKNKRGIIQIHKQTPFEDGQMPEVFFSLDGNYTLSYELFRQKNIKKISLGYLDTRRQGLELTKFAKWVGKKETHPGESQGYYNHGQYLDGWTYNTYSIGTPFIPNNLDLKNPIKQFELFTTNNRVQAYFLAIKGNLNGLEYNFKNSYSLNYGLYGLTWQPVLRQFSSNYELIFPKLYRNFRIKSSISADFGSLFLTMSESIFQFSEIGNILHQKLGSEKQNIIFSNFFIHSNCFC